MHLSPKLCRMFLQGELAGEALVNAALSHLMDECDECRQVWEQMVAMTSSAQTASAGRLDGHSHDRARTGHEEVAEQESRLTELRKKRRNARQDVTSLLRMAPESRRSKIENARTRFRSRLFVEMLLEEARNRVRQDARDSADLAALVPVAVHWMAGKVEPDWAFRVTSLATAIEANALRIAGELAAADQLFHDLARRIRRNPTLNSGDLAEITTKKAALRSEQRQYDEAERLLDKAILHHRLAGNTQGLAQALILLGQVHSATEAFDRANRCYAKVIAMLDPDEEPFLVQCAVTGQVNGLCDLKSFDQAEALLEAHRDLYEGHGSYPCAVLRGMEGEIASGRGLWHSAEVAHTEAKAAFLEIGREHDATLACLHVARAMMEQGKIDQVTKMATEVLEIFRARGAEQEALSALILIQEAAASRTLTTAILRQARKRLESGSA